MGDDDAIRGEAATAPAPEPVKAEWRAGLLWFVATAIVGGLWLLVPARALGEPPAGPIGLGNGFLLGAAPAVGVARTYWRLIRTPMVPVGPSASARVVGAPGASMLFIWTLIPDLAFEFGEWFAAIPAAALPALVLGSYCEAQRRARVPVGSAEPEPPDVRELRGDPGSILVSGLIVLAAVVVLLVGVAVDELELWMVLSSLVILVSFLMIWQAPVVAALTGRRQPAAFVTWPLVAAGFIAGYSNIGEEGGPWIAQASVLAGYALVLPWLDRVRRRELRLARAAAGSLAPVVRDAEEPLVVATPSWYLSRVWWLMVIAYVGGLLTGPTALVLVSDSSSTTRTTFLALNAALLTFVLVVGPWRARSRRGALRITAGTLEVIGDNGAPATFDRHRVTLDLAPAGRKHKVVTVSLPGDVATPIPALRIRRAKSGSRLLFAHSGCLGWRAYGEAWDGEPKTLLAAIEAAAELRAIARSPDAGLRLPGPA